MKLPILWSPDVKNWLIWKDPDAGKDWRWEEKGTTEDEMVGWHHQINGYEFEQALGVGDGQGGWRAAVQGVAKSRTRLSDWTELNWTECAHCVTAIKGDINSNTIIVGDFNIPLTPTDRSSRQKINKKIQALLDTVDQTDLIVRGYSIQKQQDTLSSQVHMEHSPR